MWSNASHPVPHDKTQEIISFCSHPRTWAQARVEMTVGHYISSLWDDMAHGAWNASQEWEAVHQQRGAALFGWSSWKKSLHSNARRSWVVTWETHLPTAFLLVYWWRDDTEELGLTLYKAAPSAASRSFDKDRWGWNSFSIPPTGKKQNPLRYFTSWVR